MCVSCILRLVCHFSVLFFMAPSDSKRKLRVNNQNQDRDPLNKKLRQSSEIMKKLLRKLCQNTAFL